MKRYLMFSSVVLIAGCAADPADPVERSLAADGTFVEDPSPDQPIEKRLLAELVLPNGNVMTFSEHLDGGLEVSERGELRANAVGELPEFADASPYEMFVALAPEGASVPAALAVDQALIVADRVRTGVTGTMPAGFRVDALGGFYAKDLSRYFNTCTDTVAWSQHVGNSTIGDNCSAMAGLDINLCEANVMPFHIAECGNGLACTTYMESGYRKTRASVCGRDGTGTNRFVMGIKNHGQNNAWSFWFDKDFFDGGYYYYWYSHSTQKKDFWRADLRDDVRRINRSWWVKE